MKEIVIMLDDEDIQELKQIFENEPNFQPKAKQDYLIISILKQIIDNVPKNNL